MLIASGRSDAKAPLRKAPTSSSKRLIDRFARGTIWEASKVTLAKEKACFISSPVKLMIDLNSTKMSAVLQSIYQMPSEPNPMENLHDILMCSPNQRVDVTALVDNGSSTRSYLVTTL